MPRRLARAQRHNDALVLPQYSIPYETGPSLDRIPDDVLFEIISHLPALTEAHTLVTYHKSPQGTSPTSIPRTPTLRALSQTSKLLRSRCLAMAWQSLELCAANINQLQYSPEDIIGREIEGTTHVLSVCPYLLPLIQTVSVVLTRFRSAAEIIPAFAACLATLPNLATLQVMYGGFMIKTATKRGFKGKKFPTVRKLVLNCYSDSVYEIIKCCPNVEEVMLTGTSTYRDPVTQGLSIGNCCHVRILKGIPETSSLTRLAGQLPNLKHIGVCWQDGGDLTALTSFPLLDTIEIQLARIWLETFRASKYSDFVKQAIKILEKNESKAEKTVLLTGWYHLHDVLSKKVLQVWPET